MADGMFGNPQAGFYGALDALNRGAGVSNTLAQQRAQAIMADIEARRKDEMITAQMAAEKMKAEAYAQQVALQQKGLEQGKPYDLARARTAEMQARYPEIAAILARGKQDPIAGQAAWSQFTQRPGLEGLRETVGESFDPEAIGAYMGGIVPKEVAGLQRTEMMEQGRDDRGALDRASRERIAAMRGQIMQAIQSERDAGRPMSESQVIGALLQAVAAGTITPQELQALDIAQIMRAATASVTPGITPTISPEGQVGIGPRPQQRPSVLGAPGTAPTQRRPLTEFERK